MKRYGFIYNPRSHRGKTASVYRKIKKIAAGFDETIVVRVQEEDDIEDVTRRLLSRTDVIVACGGDGTIRKVASGLLYTEKIMGILPAGNGNDLIKSLGIPADIDRAARVLSSGKTRIMDVGQCNDSIFVNTIGFGFDGLTNHYAAQMPPFLGKLRYIFAALKASKKHTSFSVVITTPGGTTEKELIMLTAANGSVEGGSFWIAPRASLKDGMLDLVMIKPVKKWLLPFLLPLFNFRKPYWTDAYQSFNIDSCLVEFDHPVAVHIDGEIIRSTDSTFHISVIPGAVKFIGR